MQRPIISLLSDFGLKDPYVAEMKAVILNICPNVQLVDVTHEIAKFDVSAGAFALASAAPYFPRGTVHVAVVDPGVGTERRPIVVETMHSLFVGPDNGLLMLAAERESIKHVYLISERDFMLRKVSKTFHGRDIFAPAAAYLAKGYSPSRMGSEISDYIIPKFAKPTFKAKTLIGEVLYIDDFGNIITNITPKDIKKINAKEGDFLMVKLNKNSLRLKLCSTYGEVGVNELITVIGGHGFLEISVNQGNAAKRLNVKPKMHVRVSRV